METDPHLPAAHRHTIRRIARAQLTQLSGIVAGIAALLLGLSVLAILLQAQRDEARSAEWILAVAVTDPDPALVQHIIRQQRRNFTPRIVIVGTAPERLAAMLMEAGVPRANLDVAETAALGRQLRDQLPAEPNPTPILIIAPPESLVLVRKMSRDLGLDAYASSPPDQPLQIGHTLAAALAYWQYTLLGDL
jgi:hypothetical protein